jgi:hypothetical protein
MIESFSKNNKKFSRVSMTFEYFVSANVSVVHEMFIINSMKEMEYDENKISVK